jgi:hypothetical protein
VIDRVVAISKATKQSNGRLDGFAALAMTWRSGWIDI